MWQVVQILSTELFQNWVIVEIGHNFALKNPNQIRPVVFERSFRGLLQGRISILKIPNYRDNSISISSSSKARKMCVVFLNYISLV